MNLKLLSILILLLSSQVSLASPDQIAPESGFYPGGIRRLASRIGPNGFQGSKHQASIPLP